MIKIISFLLFSLVLPVFGVDYALPAANQGNWEPGVDVGVEGGIARFRPGGADERTNIINLGNAPYYLNPDNPQTTGSASAADDQLTVADPTGFRVNDFIKIDAAFQEVSTLVITGQPSSDGNVGVMLDGVINYVPVLAADTINQAAQKIRDFAYTGWTASGAGDTIVFTKNDPGGAYGDLAMFGVAIPNTASTVKGGLFSRHQITAITGSVITITPDRVSAASSAPVSTDSVRVIIDAIAAKSPDDVLFVPNGEYLLYQAIYLTDADDEFTLRGESREGVVFLIPDGGTGFASSAGSDTFPDVRTVSGSVTKGVATLSLADNSGISSGQFVTLIAANEENDARIEAGAVPIWNQKGYPDMQQLLVKVTSVGTGTITIDPPLPMDFTYRNLRVGVQTTNVGQSVFRVGFEDFTLAPADTSFGWGFRMGFFNECWAYNVRTIASSNRGYWLESSYKTEINRCMLGETVGYSSDGLIGFGRCTSCLIVDSIGRDGNYLIYDDGNSFQNAILYNFTQNVGGLYIGHGAHPCLNLFEGNVGGSYIHKDAYHGSSSNDTIFRNRNAGVILNRFVRQHAIVGNVFGVDGASNATWSFGNPNMGNGAADGFAGPTGLSDQEGEIDYAQPGYGVSGGSLNTYVIQPGDIFAGDFWEDWMLTGTLTTRTSDGVGVITMDSSVGQMFVDMGVEVNGPTIWWGTGLRQTYRANTNVTAISGLQITIGDSPTVGGTALPAEGTPVLVWTGTFGFQERDLDTQASCWIEHNYSALASGTGTLQNPTADTLPNSLAYTSQPSWWQAGLAWPPVDPTNPTFSNEIIPAGYRFVNGDAEEGSSGLTLQSFTVSVLLIGEPESYTYLQPNGVDGYRQPDGTSLYFQP